MKRDAPLAAILPDHEVLWATEILKRHAARINSFLEHAREYERTLLGEDYPKSFDLLDKIERDLGISLWLIENRIALLQLAQGLERQKAYLSSIRGQRVSNPVAVIAFYASQRSESATNPLRFKQQMAERAASWEVPEEYKMYLMFKIADDFRFSLKNCGALLQYEATSSIIDYYETFIRAAQKSALDGSLPTSLMSGLESLSAHIQDYRARKILLLYKREPSDTLPYLRLQELSPLELSLNDQFQSAAAAAQASVKVDPMDVTLRFVSAQSVAELNADEPAEVGLGGRIERLCSMLVNKTEDAEDVYHETLRLDMGFHLMGFTSQLQQFATDHFSSQPLASKIAGLRSFLDSPFLDPRHLLCLPDEMKPFYANVLLTRYGERPAVLAELWRANVELPGIDLSPIKEIGSLANDAVLRIKIDKALESKEVESALDLARELDRSGSEYSRRLAARYIAHCLLELNNLSGAIDFVVGRVMSDPPAIFLLPIDQCVERLDKSARRLLAGKLSTPIVLDLFSKVVSDRMDNIRAYAYEDFLISHGLGARPKSLDSSIALTPNC